MQVSRRPPTTVGLTLIVVLVLTVTGLAQFLAARKPAP